MRSRAVRLLVWAALCFAIGLSGCSSLSADARRRSGPAEAAMTQTEMEVAFGSLVDAIEGPPGAIRTQVDGVDVYLISDPAKDRMQMVAQVARADRLRERFLRVLLQANFHTTLDARYAISNGVVYATYLHPISSLTPAEIESALRQVVNLKKTFGSTFSSEDLRREASPSGGR